MSSLLKKVSVNADRKRTTLVRARLHFISHSNDDALLQYVSALSRFVLNLSSSHVIEDTISNIKRERMSDVLILV